jgi:tRNA(adenine34) deaminase
MITSPFGYARDYEYMGNALEQASYADAIGEVPIGAVVINTEGAIIAKAYNQVEKKHTQAAHAEIQVLTMAGALQSDWRLEGHWLYVTLEPCIMCMGLIYLSRLSGIVYAAASPLYGWQLDSSAIMSVYKIDTVRIISGVRADEAAALLKQFFKQKRNL